MEPLQWVDLTRSRPLGNVCYLRIDVKRTLRIELRMSPFGGKRPSNTATLAAEWRPWSLFSEVARFLQTGRTIEDPYDRLLWSAVVRSRGYGRRQCANTGHFLTLWRKGQIDPSPRFKIVPVNSREARESGLSTKPSYFPMLQVIRLLVLDGSAGIVTTLLIRVWWAVGGTSGVE
jgi:hypothetical protein